MLDLEWLQDGKSGHMNITEAAIHSKLSVDTIRFYEKTGMLPKLARGKRGWRDIDAGALEWLVILERLRATGMSLKDMRRFSQLVFAKDNLSLKATQERLDILTRHKAELVQRKAELRTCEVYLNMKIRIYSKQLEELS